MKCKNFAVIAVAAAISLGIGGVAQADTYDAIYSTGSGFSGFGVGAGHRGGYDADFDAVYYDTSGVKTNRLVLDVRYPIENGGVRYGVGGGITYTGGSGIAGTSNVMLTGSAEKEISEGLTASGNLHYLTKDGDFGYRFGVTKKFSETMGVKGQYLGSTASGAESEFRISAIFNMK